MAQFHGLPLNSSKLFWKPISYIFTQTQKHSFSSLLQQELDVKMESKGNSTTKAEQEISAEEEEDNNALKRTVVCHALYPVLVESHLNCLKLCLGNENDINPVAADIKLNSSVGNQTDLDQFMEAYCKTLNKLREAMEKPQQESMAFMENMHSQLEKLIDSSSTALSQNQGKLK